MLFTHFDCRSGEIPGDLQAWISRTAGDNRDRQAQLLRGLRQAKNEVLTPRQRQMLDLYYGEELNIPQIAELLGINRSTVCRTLQRAKRRLYLCLRYGL